MASFSINIFSGVLGRSGNNMREYCIWIITISCTVCNGTVRGQKIVYMLVYNSLLN